MSAMRSGVVSSLLRRAFAVRRPPVVSTSSSFSPICSTTMPAAPRSTAERSCSGSQHVPHRHQRAGLSTLRRGLTGPLSARLRLPMRGLEEFRDPEVVKVRVRCVFLSDIVHLSTSEGCTDSALFRGRRTHHAPRLYGCCGLRISWC